MLENEWSLSFPFSFTVSLFDCIKFLSNFLIPDNYPWLRHWGKWSEQVFSIYAIIFMPIQDNNGGHFFLNNYSSRAQNIWTRHVNKNQNYWPADVLYLATIIIHCIGLVHHVLNHHANIIQNILARVPYSMNLVEGKIVK